MLSSCYWLSRRSDWAPFWCGACVRALGHCSWSIRACACTSAMSCTSGSLGAISTCRWLVGSKLLTWPWWSSAALATAPLDQHLPYCSSCIESPVEELVWIQSDISRMKWKISIRRCVEGWNENYENIKTTLNEFCVSIHRIPYMGIQYTLWGIPDIQHGLSAYALDRSSVFKIYKILVQDRSVCMWPSVCTYTRNLLIASLVPFSNIFAKYLIR